MTDTFTPIGATATVQRLADTELDIPNFLHRRSAVKCLSCLVEIPGGQIAGVKCTRPMCPFNQRNAT